MSHITSLCAGCDILCGDDELRQVYVSHIPSTSDYTKNGFLVSPSGDKLYVYHYIDRFPMCDMCNTEFETDIVARYTANEDPTYPEPFIFGCDWTEQYERISSCFMLNTLSRGRNNSQHKHRTLSSTVVNYY